MTKEEIQARLSKCSPFEIEDVKFKASAVLAPLFMKNGEWNLLLTLRSPHLPNHANQISFPGGRLDPGETPVQAALRETHEEMGIAPEHVEIVGCLDDIATITGYKIRPFVGIIPHPYEYKISHQEIAEVIELPLKAFVDGGCTESPSPMTLDGKPYPVYHFHLEGRVIWGATARMIKQLVELLR